jgi:phenylacetate-coenzyme A ligase PaaK-like adenylate-forming protein
MVEFQIGDFFYPIDIFRSYFLLRSSEHWNATQFRKYQDNKLSSLLRFAGNNVPYYQELFRETGIFPAQINSDNARSALMKLPILTKSMLKENPDSFISKDFQKFHPKPVSTSGTTGTPLTIYWDKGSNVMEFCCTQRLWRWAGFRPGQTFLDLRSRPMPENDPHLHKSGQAVYIFNPKSRGIEMSSDLINDDNVRGYYEVLMRFQPGLIRGHPQAIDHLANLLTKYDLRRWKPKSITTASEMLYDFQRKHIQEAFSAPILDSYGLKEHNVFIAQCREGSYHISPEYGICEILDDTGNLVAPGQEGWIIATGLHNYAQPLLRYNTLDRAIASPASSCLCGRTLPTVHSLIGRVDDYIYSKDGKRYSGFSFAFFDRPGLRKARLVQIDSENVEIETISDRDFTTSIQQDLIQTLETKVNHQIKFRIKPVQDIRQDIPGKFKFVVSHIKI